VPEENIGVALIGCGGMARHYRAVYAHHPRTRLRLVVDVDAQVAQSAAQELGADRFSTRWQDALTDEIGLVDISTPNHLHAEQAVAALRAGKHVILQKPMAPTITECDAIVAAAAASGKSAGVYMSDLEDPAVWDMRTLIQGGYLGRVTGIRARYAHRGGLTAPPQGSWRGSAEKTGGGSFIQLAIHQTNLATWLLGAPIVSVTGLMANLMCENIGGDDTAAAVAAFADGTIGVFESAWNAEGSAFQVYGSEGTLTLFGCEGARIEGQLSRPFHGTVLQSDSHGRVVREGIPSAALRSHENPLNQHTAFIDAVLTGAPPEVSVVTGRYDVAVCKALALSAETGRRVSVQEVLEGEM